MVRWRGYVRSPKAISATEFSADPSLSRRAALSAWGSDSNVEIGLGAELRLLEYGQRLRLRARNVMGAPGISTGRALFEGALKGGAQALQASVGLEVGVSADFVTLKPQHADWPMPEGDAILDPLIFAPGSLPVDCVMVRGRALVEGGRHIARAAIARRYVATMRKLLA